jgi:UDP-N-acetylglucosamine diphosphorylase/glucosamine-1-phosphate N-acetyltransferase
MSIRICFYEDEHFKQFSPLTYLRPVYCLRAGILPLFRRVERYFDHPEISLASRHALAGSMAGELRDYPVNIIKRQEHQAVLFLNGRIRTYGNLAEVMRGARLITRIVGQDGKPVGMYCPSEAITEVSKVASPEQYQTAFQNNRNDLAEFETDATLYERCWEIVSDIETEIAADFAHLQSEFVKHDLARVYTGAYLIKPEQICLGRGVQVLPGSLLDASNGPIYVGDETRIESQVAVYGPCYIGPNSQVLAGKITACSIGHTCRAGGEIEESVFQSYVNKYHAGFIGHSYVGSWVNFGAMTTNSDLKNNYSTINVSVNGQLIDTGSIKVGSFIGDHTKFGIGTLLNTGINVGVSCNLYGGTLFADREIPSFSWGMPSELEGYRFDKALQTMQRTADRRNVSLTQGEEELLRALSEGQVPEAGVMSL